MESLRLVRMRSRVSLVVMLRDCSAFAPPFVQGMEVRLDGFPARPVAKPDGSYIFSDLEPGVYRLQINSSYYFPEERAVLVDKDNLVIHIPLIPVPSFPYKPGLALIRAKVVRNSGDPVPGAVVHASVQSEHGARGRMIDEQAREEADEITVSLLMGSIGSGDLFMLVDKNGDGERVCISGEREYRRRYGLLTPLKRAYPRGTLLFPICVGKTTDKGELAIAISTGRSRMVDVELRLQADDGRAESVRRVAAVESDTVNLGTWSL